MNAQTAIADRNEKIESKIDREVAGGLTVSSGGAAVTITPRNMGEVMEFAKMMSLGGFAIRPAFRGNPGACLAITLQALRWGMDPIAVSNKAYVTTSKGGEQQLAYEAQLVHAVVNERAPLQKRLKVTFTGENGNRRCHVEGLLKGEDESAPYDSPLFSKINPKNSPLWQTDPDQQLRYYSVRAWARAHVPEVLLGVYTDDEAGTGPENAVDVTPPARPTRAEFRAPATTEVLPPAEAKAAEEPFAFEVCSAEGEVVLETENGPAAAALFVEMMDAAANPGPLQTIWENNSPWIAQLDQPLADEVRGAHERNEARLERPAPDFASLHADLVKELETVSAPNLAGWLAKSEGVQQLKLDAPALYADICDRVQARGKGRR